MLRPRPLQCRHCSGLVLAVRVPPSLPSVRGPERAWVHATRAAELRAMRSYSFAIAWLTLLIGSSFAYLHARTHSRLPARMDEPPKTQECAASSTHRRTYANWQVTEAVARTSIPARTLHACMHAHSFAGMPCARHSHMTRSLANMPAVLTQRPETDANERTQRAQQNAKSRTPRKAVQAWIGCIGSAYCLRTACAWPHEAHGAQTNANMLAKHLTVRSLCADDYGRARFEKV